MYIALCSKYTLSPENKRMLHSIYVYIVILLYIYPLINQRSISPFSLLHLDICIINFSCKIFGYISHERETLNGNAWVPLLSISS